MVSAPLLARAVVLIGIALIVAGFYVLAGLAAALIVGGGALVVCGLLFVDVDRKQG